MRFDLEQFLALTMALGTAGAVGVAAYTNYEARAEAAQSDEAEHAPAEAEEEFPEAEPEPERPPAPPPAAAPTPEPMPAFDAPEEELDAAPGPQVESFNW